VSPRHEVRLENSGPEVRLVLGGEIDMDAADELHRIGRRAVAAAPARVVLDLSRTTFLDSAGVGGLVSLRNGASEQSIPVHLRPGPPNVMRVLDIVGLVDAFDRAND
jgi:anti-sigma B factor antagonist